MAWVTPKAHPHWIASERLLEIAHASQSTEDFLQKVCTPLIQWLKHSNSKGSRKSTPAGTIKRPLVLMWFCMWLAERALLLFPTVITARMTELYPLPYREMLREFLRPADVAAACNAFYQKVMKVIPGSEGQRDRTRLAIDIANLLAPGTAQGRISAEYLGHIKKYVSQMRRTELRIYSLLWSVEANRLRDNNVDSQTLRELTRHVLPYGQSAHSMESRLWSWIDDPSHEGRLWNRYGRSGFVAGPNLLSHTAEIRKIFPAVAGKSAEKVSLVLGIWLYFLSSLPDSDVPAHVVDIKPSMMDSLRDQIQTRPEGTITSRGFFPRSLRTCNRSSNGSGPSTP